MMDPSNEAVILAYTQDTEYLLRLAEKKDLSLRIISPEIMDSASVANGSGLIATD